MSGNDFDLVACIDLARSVGADTQSVEVRAAEGGLPKSMAESVSAFANGSGGVIVCGLSEHDDFSLANNFNAARISAALAQLCSDAVEPPVRATIEVVPFEGASVVVAHVPELEPRLKPCYVKARSLYDGAFVRVGDGDRHLSRYEVDRLLEERNQPRYDEAIVREATESDLEQELLQGFLKRERANSPRLFGGLGDRDALLAMGALRVDEEGQARPTLAGLLAFGRYPQQFFPRVCVSFAAFPGADKGALSEGGARLVDSRTIEGPVPMMVAETLAHVRRNMRYASYVVGAGRVDVPDYPEVAVREAVANALMHRDYSPEGCASPVQVMMYSDRMEIVSPGGLFGVVTVDNIGSMDATSSRNMRLCRLLEGTPYPVGYPEVGYVVENKGMGFAQIRSSLADSGKPAPVLLDDISTFRVTLRKGVQQEEVGQKTVVGFDERKALVRGMVERQGSVSTAEASAELGTSSATARRVIYAMVDAGELRRVPGTSTRNARYERA